MHNEDFSTEHFNVPVDIRFFPGNTTGAEYIGIITVGPFVFFVFFSPIFLRRIGFCSPYMVAYHASWQLTHFDTTTAAFLVKI